MRGINKVTILGNLGQDPELRQAGGINVCSVSVATTEKWKDKNTGEQKEATEWHRCIIWGRQGEVAAQYLHKGSKVYLEGKLQTRKWQDKEGNDKYTTEIVVNDFRLLDPPPENQQPPRAHQQPPQQPYQQPQQGGFIDDDIPFAPYMRGSV